MKANLIIPVGSLTMAKTRLAPVLSPDARADLICGLLCHVIETAGHVAGIASITVISGDPAIRALAESCGASTLADPARGGLNGALEYAATRTRNGRGILILPADLPLLEPDDIAAMLPCGPQCAAIAPDRAGTGTNALYLSTGAAVAFRFGAGSYASHCGAARAAGLALTVVQRPGLAFDLDTPADHGEWISRRQSPRNRSVA